MCPTMFTQSQTITFVGQSIIHQAATEKDPVRRHNLIEQGLTQLLKLPENINLSAVVPDLCKTHRYEAIVALCMRKIEVMRKLIHDSKRKHSQSNAMQESSEANNLLNVSMNSVQSRHNREFNHSQVTLQEETN